MKGRAAVNLNCGDKDEKVSFSKLRLIQFVPTVVYKGCTEMA